MHTVELLIGGLAVLTSLLFISFIGLLWGLKQLLNIGQQNDAMLILLNQISMKIWQAARLQTEPHEDAGGDTPAVERRLTLHRQSHEVYVSPEPRFAGLK